MKRLLILPVLLLSACGSESVVTASHIEFAQFMCANNGGLKSIRNAEVVEDFEICGYKCSRKTGKLEYKADLLCNNGASFKMGIAK